MSNGLYVPQGSFMNPEAEKDLSYTVQAVGELIRDLYPDMHMARLPTGMLAIIHTPRDGMPPYIVREVPDQEVNAGLLTWIVERDQTKVDVFKTIETHNAMNRALEAKEAELRLSEGTEFAEAVFKSKKHYYRHDGKVYS